MDRRFKVLAVAALLPLLAGCMPDSPRTILNWDVNDSLPKAHAQQSPDRNAAGTYAYQGDSHAVPAPKSRSAVTAINLAPVTGASSVAFAWPVQGPVISPFGVTS